MFRYANAAVLAVLIASSASAHKVVEPGVTDKIAKGTFSARPETAWNRLQQRESKYQEVWTIDGDRLNRVVFFGGVPIGEPLLKERNKKIDPLPKVSGNMLLPDIPVIVERTYRTSYGISVMSIGKQEPATLAGMPAISFEYTFIDPEYEVETRGEAVGLLHNNKLYLVAFEAPDLYYFQRDIEKFRELIKTVKIEK